MSPLTPLFIAIDTFRGTDDFEYKSFDLVTDRNNLRKLLRWTQGSAKDFRIDIDLAGDTCLFTRTEAMDHEWIDYFCGYGHQYKMAATKLPRRWEAAASHYRIISMKFGDLNILLRSAVDACTGEQSVESLTSSFSALGSSDGTSSDSADRVVSGVSVKQSHPRELVPQSSLIELKTRSVRKEMDWDEVFPQLYLSQTAWLHIARHERGKFSAPEKVELSSPQMLAHAKEAEESTMGMLKKTLEEVLVVVRREGEGTPLCLTCIGGKLSLYKRKLGTGKNHR
ncbi:hypothetical protein PUNSTDRAFT_132583 [Punctularia strigosozonata HHB-11173 SS5]|uniref:uncharacterized protein n=1 Tax=Punctularia strigosozonata (strain HHB-11173) TaxID=741275 RepID=UPI00044165A4|nr:uncharacterized protein PUNSTDRAFT_132583 [Punctularia strigosozonata HHB-11173 SS5]EIN10493.1 hypothetical protein PUNSTDRAFT_132583 [Punctularia strigosozonata HHB-11173 SS5]